MSVPCKFRVSSVAAPAILLLLLAAPATAQNILFFLTDDQRHDQFGAAGHPVLQTPTMDRLAAEGVRFRNAFVTTSICAASRATILTGLYERSHRFTFETPPLRDEVTATSYPALLRQAGYRTGFVGKFGMVAEPGAVERMFDMFEPLDRDPYVRQQPDGSRRHISQIAGDKAIEFLRLRDGGQPFALSVSFNAPHAEDEDKDDHYPWPSVVDGMYDDQEIGPPILSAPQVFASQPEFLKTSLNRERYFWRWDTPEKYQKNIRGYYRMISGVDHVMARVLDELERLDLADDTVVIFAGDNGYYLGQRGFAGKWSHYEESLRVPLIVKDPRVDGSLRGRVVDAMALNVDIPATILAIAGIDVPAPYQGSSLVPFVQGRVPEAWRTDFFAEHLFDHPKIPKREGVRSERWVYARYFEQEPVFELLHDLENDPLQLQNLAGDLRYVEPLGRMRARTDALRDSYGGRYEKEAFSGPGGLQAEPQGPEAPPNVLFPDVVQRLSREIGRWWTETPPVASPR